MTGCGMTRGPPPEEKLPRLRKTVKGGTWVRALLIFLFSSNRCVTLNDHQCEIDKQGMEEWWSERDNG